MIFIPSGLCLESSLYNITESVLFVCCFAISLSALFHAEGEETGWRESFAKWISSILAHWGVSATSLMRIMVLLGDRVGDPLDASKMKIEISHFSWRYWGLKFWLEQGECSG